MMKRRQTFFFFVCLSLLSRFAFAEPNSITPSTSSVQHQIEETQAFYQQKYKQLEAKVGKLFHVNYEALMATQQTQMQELNFKMGMVNQMESLEARAAQMEALKKQFASEDLQKAMEIYYYFQNEIEQDHEFVGQLLAKLEAILDAAIQEDPFFKYVFTSSEFRDEYGLVMKRVVWQIQPGEEVSGQTVPLTVHSIFGDKSRTPLLVKLTPVAFKSHAFLKSILIHELNHVMMFKDVRFLNASKFEGGAVRMAEGSFTHYFKQLSPSNPSYQFYLIHEYYSFKAQIFFDDEMAPENLKLDTDNRHYFENAMKWTHEQLHGRNQMFVKREKDPAIVPWLQKFYPQTVKPASL